MMTPSLIEELIDPRLMGKQLHFLTDVEVGHGCSKIEQRHVVELEVRVDGE